MTNYREEDGPTLSTALKWLAGVLAVIVLAYARACGMENHLAPAWHCNCGVWAFKDVDRLVAAIGSGYNNIKVIGSVSLWGRVIETENGYRAQYAYPSELWLLDGSLEELALIYGVPVRK